MNMGWCISCTSNSQRPAVDDCVICITREVKMTRRISRRGFFKTGAAVVASTVLAGCEQNRRW